MCDRSQQFHLSSRENVYIYSGLYFLATFTRY